MASALELYFYNLVFPYNFITGIQIMKSQGLLGKLITLGSILDLLVFAILLKLNKDGIAGVVLVIVLTVLTLFI
jgi:hypothetical protein